MIWGFEEVGSKRKYGFLKELNREQKVQGCDATGAEQN
jgi:hypothetical protein